MQFVIAFSKGLRLTEDQEICRYAEPSSLQDAVRLVLYSSGQRSLLAPSPAKKVRFARTDAASKETTVSVQMSPTVPAEQINQVVNQICAKMSAPTTSLSKPSVHFMKQRRQNSPWRYEQDFTKAPSQTVYGGSFGNNYHRRGRGRYRGSYQGNFRGNSSRRGFRGGKTRSDRTCNCCGQQGHFNNVQGF